MKRNLLLVMCALLALLAMARQPQRGYRGFLDWNNDLTSQDSFDGSKVAAYFTGFSTSHGYQFNQWLFVGAGLSVENCRKFDRYIVPVFVHGRTDLKFGRFTPFGDVKIGFNMTDGGGMYFSPTIGYRFSWGRKMGVNLGVGLTLKGYKVEMYEAGTDGNGYFVGNYIGSRHLYTAMFAFRLGIDF